MHILLIWVILLCVLPNILFSQIEANFIANPVKGCAPLVVSFQNLSTGNITSYFWDFGNGNYSNLPNPTVNYINPGTYTVKLIVGNGVTFDTLIRYDYIKVFKKPTANFSVSPQYGCVPLTVNFTNTSQVGSAPISNFLWDFGNGYNSTAQNPSHFYSQSGYYNVSLTVTDTNGCSNSITIPNAVIVSSYPNVNFTANVTSACVPPLTVHFINQSTGMGTLNYLWNFGDGTATSTLQNPTHTYTSVGSYSVTLIVTNQYGCSDTLTINNFINISTINAAFHIQEGDTVCPNQTVHFINDSGTNALWAFGDNTASTDLNPTHVYTNPGTYTIIMIAAPGTPCQDTAFGTLYVRPYPNAQFTFSSSFSCGNPITFTPYLSNGTSYIWNFGDNTTSNQQTPSHTYTQNGNYYVSLIVTDQHGCTNAYQSPTPIIVEKPVCEFDGNPKNGCKPLTVNFIDQSTCNVNYTQITSWQWNFGDGGTSNIQNPTHTYTDTGTFIVTLVITTNLGCTAIDTMKVEVGTHQNPQISFDVTSICSNDTAHFISLSTDSNFIDSYSWTLVNDSNVVVATSTNAHPTFNSFNGIGYITIQYTIENNGCFDTLTVDSAFKVNGPFGGSIDTAMVGCHNPYLIGAIINEVKQATRWYWDMNNDGIYEDSTILNYVGYGFNDTCWFIYPSRGSYTIRFVAYNDSTGCMWETSKTIVVRDIQANLHVNSPVCPNNVFLNTANSVDFDNITFIYGDGYTSTLSYQQYLLDTLFYHQYVYHNYPQQSDTITAYIYLTNNIGCSDTDSVTFIVFSPKPGFYADNYTFCVPFTVNFTDTSTADTTIIYWSWYIQPIGMSSVDTNPSFNFTVPATYTVALTVVDAIGCQATTYQYIYANQIVSQFSVSDNTICVYDSIQFIPNVPNATTFIWNYGDGSQWDTAMNPYHQYTDTGKYTVTLIASNQYPNCIDTAIITDYVQVQDITVNFVVANTDTNCYPFPVQITNLTSTAYSPTWYWSFGDNSYSDQHTPFHNYTMPGEYWLVLEATTSFGCKDKDSIKITVGGPYTQISVSDSIICKGDTVHFTVTNPENITIYNWDFGDGSSANAQNVSHVYNFVPPSGQFTASLVYCSEATCCQFDTAKINIFQVFANFNYYISNGLTDTSACGSATVYFSNESAGASSYLWHFGDGTTSTEFIPSQHTYSNSSDTSMVIPITLQITSDIGCKDSVTKFITLHNIPDISICNDVFICRGGSTQLWVQGGNSVSWIPTEGLSNYLVFNPIASPDSTTTYIASVYDVYGCKNTDTVTVWVQQPPTLVISNDTTIIIGEVVNLWSISDQQNLSYLWQPATYLSCIDCANPQAKPLQSITYTLQIQDSLKCFTISDAVHIEVKEEYTVDVPMAFTPNGDGINDVLYVRGWGIKNLIEFKIFNRWGQCIFSTNNINEGWDGTYKGKPQDIDTYAYYVKVETYSNNKTLEKKGVVNLLR
ncbi:MAG: PKD domain-containing protein [Bacteroidales bacterium]|nr:PKD domain-containing protein [Bacteroidales bacterium]